MQTPYRVTATSELCLGHFQALHPIHSDALILVQQLLPPSTTERPGPGHATRTVI